MILTQWGRGKMAAIFQTTYSNAFSWIKMFEFRLRFHWNLSLGVQLIISSIGSDNGLAPARQQVINWTNYDGLFYWPIYASLGLHEFIITWFVIEYGNYANPVYGVATICHQVRCLRWGHPSLFHTATSLLIWYKMFSMRDISYRLMWMKFINMLSVYAQSGTHRRFNWWIISVLT